MTTRDKKARRLLLIMLAIVIALGVLTQACHAEGGFETETVWVLCQPDSYVVIRSHPSKNSDLAGMAYAGDDFETDGKRKDHYLHVYAPIELGEGWINLGYIVFYEPQEVNQRKIVEAKGRVAARRTIEGKLRRWLDINSELIVYWESEEWSVTNKGFVKSQFISETELDY